MNYLNQSLEDSAPHDLDFDDSANDLWSLYGKEAKSHDEARIKTLKDDMDGILIYVCVCLLWSAWVDVTLVPGWFTIWCSHRVRRAKDSGFESRPCSPVGLLPESNIATTRLDGKPDLDKFYTFNALIALPDFSCVGIGPPGEYFLATKPCMQSVCGPPCNAHQGMGEGLHAHLPAV